MNKLNYLLVSVVFIIGCSSATVNPYRIDSYLVPTNPKAVMVYKKIPAGREYITLGEVTVSATKWQRVEKRLKKEAAKLGGDAVYIISEVIAGRGEGGVCSTSLHVSGVVIKFKGTGACKM